MEGVRLNLVESLDEAHQFIEWLGRDRKWLAVDTETGGLDWFRDPLRLVQFGDHETGWALSYRDWRGVIKTALERYERPMVGHNAKFDSHFLLHNELPLQRHLFHDTRTMAHLIDSSRSTSLKNLSEDLLSDQAKQGQTLLRKEMARNGWTWATVPETLPAYWCYAALDCVLTAQLADMFWPTIESQFKQIYDIEFGTSLALMDMERRGVRIDPEYAQAQLWNLEEKANVIRQEVKEQWNINPGSGPQVAMQLQKDGVELTKRTKDGKWAVDEDVLSGIDHPLAQTVLSLRSLEKDAKTYFRAFMELSDDKYRIHPQINALGARTGRMSCARPNLQNVPRTAFVRDAFLPSPGNVLVSIDYDAMEMRVFAHFAQEQGMLEAIRQGVDLHTYVAQRVFRTEQPSKQQRQTAKGANFANIYGAGTETFAGQVGLSLPEAQMFKAQYDREFPGVARFMRTMDQAIKERAEGGDRGYLRSPWGRWHWIDVDKTYVAVNYLVQGTCADLLKQKICDLDASGLADYLVLPVHDELLFDVPADEAEDFSRQVGEVMEERDRFSVPLSVGVDILDRWGDKYR